MTSGEMDEARAQSLRASVHRRQHRGLITIGLEGQIPQVFSATRHRWAQCYLRNRIQVTELGQAGWKTLGQDPTSSRCLQNADLVRDESVAGLPQQEKGTDPSARPLGTMCTYLLSGAARCLQDLLSL